MKCKNCGEKDAVKYSKYSNGDFCCKKCARAYSTKEKRTEINKKVSEKLTGRRIIGQTGEKNSNYKHGKFCVKNLTDDDKIQIKKTKRIQIICLTCGKTHEIKLSKKGQMFCSSICKNNNEEYKKKLSELSKNKCKNINERIRLREIGRKGGFGEKGITKGGIKYQSKLEKKCFEFLEEIKIDFIPHKNIPNSSKISDIFLIKEDFWIELDGIDREKRKQWLGNDYEYWLEKMNIYSKNNLNYKVIKTFNDFKSFIENEILRHKFE